MATLRCFWCEPTGEKDGDASIYLRTDTGATFVLGQAPPGAMYYADWLTQFGHVGPDGHCLIVVTSWGPWNVDAGFEIPSPGKWTRTGTPPNVTARPSIGQGQRPDGSWTYHAWLTDGQLIDC